MSVLCSRHRVAPEQTLTEPYFTAIIDAVVTWYVVELVNVVVCTGVYLFLITLCTVFIHYLCPHDCKLYLDVCMRRPSYVCVQVGS